MARRTHALLLPALLLLPLLGGRRGGWAALTVEDLPDFVEAGKPVALSFMVRQHGVTPLPGLHPTIEARAGAKTASLVAQPGAVAGQYIAELRVPDPGDWTLTINSGFGNSRLTLLPIRAIPTGAKPPEAPSDQERGRRLFVAKGCIGCHTRKDVDVGGGAMIGPELTGKRYPPESLQRFLADPAANATHSGSFRMPNLGLRQQEIAALVAFLNAGRP